MSGLYWPYPTVLTVVMAVGIGFVALLTAAAAERFIRPRSDEADEIEAQLEAIAARLAAIEARLERG